MKKIRQKIDTVMYGSGREPFTFFQFFLYILSTLYGWGVKLRSQLYDRGLINQEKLPCRVVSIGNLSVGGAGKTPMTIYVAQMIRDFGYKPVVISRGYKGEMEKTGGIVSDGEACLVGPDKAGDEPFMISQTLKGIPVIVGKNRFEAGMRALSAFPADVIVLDDGFQHRRLKRDLDLVLIDDQIFFGNGHLVPRGILREPVSGLSRGHAYILTRSEHRFSGHSDMLENMFPGKTVFKAFHVPYIHSISGGGAPHPQDLPLPYGSEDFSFLQNTDVFVFSGIAKNHKFREMVKPRVKNIAGFLEYPDHHRFTPQDLQDIFRRAKQSGADKIITTEKDFSRIGNQWSVHINLVVIGVKISFGNEKKRFCDFIRECLMKGADNFS